MHARPTRLRSVVAKLLAQSASRSARRRAALGLVLLTAACASGPQLQQATLRCDRPFEAGGFIGLYAFEGKRLVEVPAGSSDVDLAYYFDADDGARGALIGFGDESGSLYPLGFRSWDQLAVGRLPPVTGGWRPGLMPMDSGRAGFAFWVETHRRELVLVRLTSVADATWADLVEGVVPSLQLEWMWPPIPPLDE